MAETDWHDDTGHTKNGRPDPDHVGHYISLWVTDVGWMCKIRWGTTFGHITFATGETAVEALEVAAEQAARNGCPLSWLPGAVILDPRA